MPKLLTLSTMTLTCMSALCPQVCWNMCEIYWYLNQSAECNNMENHDSGGCILVQFSQGTLNFSFCKFETASVKISTWRLTYTRLNFSQNIMIIHHGLMGSKTWVYCRNALFCASCERDHGFKFATAGARGRKSGRACTVRFRADKRGFARHACE